MVKKNITLDIFMKGDAKMEKREHKTEIEGPYPLPKGWKWVTLGDVAKIVMGQSPPSTTYNKEGIGLPFYQGKADFGERYPTPRIWCSKPNKIAELGDILISVRAPVGPVNLCKDKSCIGRGLAAIRCKNTILDNLFLFYYLRSIESNWKGKGSTFEAIKKRDLENLRIPLPPLEEQKRIVSRLEQLVSRVEEAKRLRKLAKEETEKIMQAALHKVFSRAEEKEWKWLKIKDVVREFQSGFACSKIYATKSGIPHLRPNNIGFWGELDLTELVFIPPEMVDIDKYSLRKGDVLFNNTNSKELVGRACIIREDLNYGFSNHITRLRVNEKLIIPEWLVSSINYLWLRGYFLAICRKWIGQAGVNMTMLKNTKIPLPSLEEQKQIATYLDKLSKTIKSLNKLQQSTDEELEKLVPAILDKAFKGRL